MNLQQELNMSPKNPVVPTLSFEEQVIAMLTRIETRLTSLEETVEQLDEHVSDLSADYGTGYEVD